MADPALRVAGARRVSARDAARRRAARLCRRWCCSLASGRPVFAGAVAFALGAGFAFADRTLRDTLREPVVFTALSELPQLFTHPHLYLPFAGTGLVVGGAATAVLAGLGAAARRAGGDAAASAGRASCSRAALRCCCTGSAASRGLAAPPVRCAGWGRAVSRSPMRRGSGRSRCRSSTASSPALSGRRGAPDSPAPARAATSAAARPIVLVQCESFFDARRALPDLPRDFLAGYDAACARGSHGRLTVPAWGANTTRAEFAVLTGIGDAALGYDRFNPYHALARTPIASEVWRLRQAGYRTICLHPFDRRFFRRDLAMPALGFEAFLGRETLGGSRAPPYMSDPRTGRPHILRVLDEAGPRTFIFAITMGNHGPWLAERSPPSDPRSRGSSMTGHRVPQAQRRRAAALSRRAARSDEMLQRPDRRAGAARRIRRAARLLWRSSAEPATRLCLARL